MMDAGHYRDPTEHLRDELALCEVFIRRAMGRGQRRGWFPGDPSDVPDNDVLVEAFRRIEDRVARSREASIVLPMDALRLRMSLTLMEQRVLWTLIP